MPSGQVAASGGGPPYIWAMTSMESSAVPGPAPMSGRTVVITGANSGVGKATATALASLGARTVITARSRSRGEEALADIRRASGSDQVDLVVFDLADLHSVGDGARELIDRYQQIHVLVNNAGLVLSARTETKDGFESTLAINHLGPFLLTQLLSDRLVDSAPSRVVNVASTAHRSARRGMGFDDLQSQQRYRGMQVYARSKLANILFTTELARRMTGSGVTANSLHPGTVATGYARDGDTTGFLAFGVKVIKPFILTPEKGARTSVYLASSPHVDGVTGQYFVKCRPRTPSAAARDEAAAALLWSVSEELVDQATS
jgi:NAD(P)-dependent dehydrogenase (short-subunit alcohol dehydrogenase family)